MLRVRERLRKLVFERFIRSHLREVVYPRFPILLDYPLQVIPRYGDGKPPHDMLNGILSRRKDAYRAQLTILMSYAEGLRSIPENDVSPGQGEPFWGNSFFSSLDAIALYGLLGSMRPRRYLEIGSGNSTKFARRAVRDLELGTHITSVDPEPRAEIDTICDRVIRRPLEEVDLTIFDDLEAGDFLFVDNSHRIFQNSDATVFFLDVLPRLKNGVVVHIHDIFLPFDYPTLWAKRYYSEQYMLAAFLLAESEKIEVTLPLAYISKEPSLLELVTSSPLGDVIQRSFLRYRSLTGGYVGVSFWCRRT